MSPAQSVIDASARIYLAGHTGMVGSALVRALRRAGFRNLILRTHKELDLTNQEAVAHLFAEAKPEYVFLAAAKVGGILANQVLPADFIDQNLAIQHNVIKQSHRVGVKRLLFLGSSCVYPKHCPQPIKEEYLMGGPCEPTNRPYAVAKIAGIEMCWAYNRQYHTHFLAVMPTNLYGEGDNYDLDTSHVIPALLRKISEAKEQGHATATVWGTGEPQREFLHSDDLANACLFLMYLPDSDFLYLTAEGRTPLVNIGFGEDLKIRELAELIADIVGFTGRLVFEPTKPDGTPRKLLDCSVMNKLGWRPVISLRSGLERVYQNHFERRFTTIP
jgi:GDP-L-fucose synthase